MQVDLYRLNNMQGAFVKYLVVLAGQEPEIECAYTAVLIAADTPMEIGEGLGPR